MNGKASTDVLPLHDGATEVIGELRVLDTRFKVIALSDGPGDTRSGIADGASLAVHRHDVDHEMVSFEVAGRKCGLVADLAQPAQPVADPSAVLTRRELQIACLVAIGYVNKRIAAELDISEWTVSTHLRRIFVKLGVRTRAALAFRCAMLVHDAPPG